MAQAEKTAVHPTVFRNEEGELIRFIMPSGLEILPKNQEQADYMALLLKKRSLYVATGDAGTGKTFLAVAFAVHAENERRKTMGKSKDKHIITLVRPALDSGEKMGHLPGTFKEKQDPYMQPFYDAFRKMFKDFDASVKATDSLGVSRLEISDFHIEIAPIAFMRGRNFENRTIILDEAQNTTANQMKMFVTRMDNDSRMIICGDVSQCDLPDERDSGLIDLIKVLKEMPKPTGEDDEYEYVELKEVVRHKMVARLVKGYNNAYNTSRGHPSRSK